MEHVFVLMFNNFDCLETSTSVYARREDAVATVESEMEMHVAEGKSVEHQNDFCWIVYRDESQTEALYEATISRLEVLQVPFVTHYGD